jgi:hypothetical protein
MTWVCLGGGKVMVRTRLLCERRAESRDVENGKQKRCKSSKLLESNLNILVLPKIVKTTYFHGIYRSKIISKCLEIEIVSLHLDTGSAKMIEN